MATKIYNPTDSAQIVFDDSAKPEKLYVTDIHCRFGFFDDIVWLIDLDEPNAYIVNTDVSNIQNEAGAAVGNAAAVETYLLGVIGG